MAIEINPSTPSNPIPSVNGISVIWLGNWSSNKIYRRNEGVFYNGSSYRANKTTSQTPSLLATDWDLLAQGGGETINSTNLDELTDVVITSPTDGQSLVYDNSTGKWVNETIISSGGGSGEINTASNVGTGGVGVFRQKTGVNLEFKKLNAASNKISVTDDTTNSDVDIDVVEANLTLGNLAGTLPISKGGTGSTTSLDALTALGAASSTTLTSHTGNTNNPHNTTAAQVGNSTAQWNSDKLQGVNIHTAAPTNGQVLTYSSTNTRWEPQTPTAFGEANTASNIGTGGVGVFRQKTGVNLEFKRLNAGSSKITITDDTVNNEIDIDVTEANLSLSNIGGTLPLTKGGTGATTASAALTALGGLASTTRGAANGVASLDASTLIPIAQIPSTIARVSQVTASQVGNTTAQWNANQIQGRSVSSTAPTNGQAIVWNSTSSTWQPTTISGSGEINTASNVGTGGVGVFRQKTGVNLEFRNINAGSNRITVTSDTVANEIDIDVIEANLSLPNLGGTLPISKGGTGATTASAALTALGGLATTARGTANGVASLDANTLIPDAQIPTSIARVSQVTASQVGNTTAQWNANQIRGANISTIPPANGQVLTYNTANTSWEPSTPSSGGSGSSNDYFPGYISNRSYPLANSGSRISFYCPLDTCIYVPFYLPKGGTFNQVSFRVESGAVGNARVGIYSHNNSTALPGTLIYDSGATSVQTTGNKSINVTWAFSAGLYWFVFCSSADITISGCTSTAYSEFLLGVNITNMLSDFVGRFIVNQTFATLPTTPTISTRFYDYHFPLIYLRAA
ncbi:MAG: beta strand repeat-containing protein [Gloeotrichia echinulata DVL01]